VLIDEEPGFIPYRPVIACSNQQYQRLLMSKRIPVDWLHWILYDPLSVLIHHATSDPISQNDGNQVHYIPSEKMH
jgi:hypothetical protein